MQEALFVPAFFNTHASLIVYFFSLSLIIRLRLKTANPKVKATKTIEPMTFKLYIA